MDSVRFVFASIAVFVLAFAGMFAAQTRMPVTAMRVESKPAPHVAPAEESVKTDIRVDADASTIPQTAGEKQRDELRLDLLQAAIGYKLSPCDETMKNNLISAVVNYTNAWQAKLNCESGVDGCPESYDERTDAADAAFKTLADVNVQKQLREAYQQGGITEADFPAGVGNRAFALIGLPFGERTPVCAVAREAQNHQ